MNIYTSFSQLFSFSFLMSCFLQMLEESVAPLRDLKDSPHPAQVVEAALLPSDSIFLFCLLDRVGSAPSSWQMWHTVLNCFPKFWRPIHTITGRFEKKEKRKGKGGGELVVFGQSYLRFIVVSLTVAPPQHNPLNQTNSRICPF